MTVKMYDIGMDYVHTDAVAKTAAKPMQKKSKRKSRKPTPEPEMAKKSRRRSRRGLSMKIKADGTVHVRHMSDPISGLAIMPPIEVVLE